MNSARTLAILVLGVGLAGLLCASPVMAASGTDLALDRIERIMDDVEQIQWIIKDRPHEAESVRERLLSREAELERARINAMSAAGGVSRRRVASLRAHGMSWSLIAREMGVSPLVVGVATGRYGERNYWRGHDHEDDDHYKKWHGKIKEKQRLPPGIAKKIRRGDRDNRND
jgi:hypothetical protein